MDPGRLNSASSQSVTQSVCSSTT